MRSRIGRHDLVARIPARIAVDDAGNRHSRHLLLGRDGSTFPNRLWLCWTLVVALLDRGIFDMDAFTRLVTPFALVAARRNASMRHYRSD